MLAVNTKRGASGGNRAALLPLLGLLWGACRVANGNVVHNVVVSNTTASEAAGTMDPKSWAPFIVQEPDKEKAMEGETVVLGCEFFNPKGASLSNTTVKWYKGEGKERVHFMENNETMVANYSRAFISGDLSKGEASMTILNVTTDDHDTYFCQVTLPSGEEVTGAGVKVRIRTAQSSHSGGESIGTIIGVVVAAVGILIGLIIILTPRFRKHLPCIK